MRRLLPLLLLAACELSSPEGSATETEATDTESPFPAEVPAYSGGTCPDWDAGGNDGFVSGTEERELRVFLPEEPRGAPLLIVWHWLGGSAQQAASAFETRQLATEEGWIVLVPDSLEDRAFEWNFLVEPEGNADLLFFDDLLACADANWGFDPERVYVTGMSAGGLWSTYVGVHRSEHLTAVAPLAGGMFDESYRTPARDIPWMLTWGGPEDVVFMSFHEANLDLLDSLEDDEQFVVACEHDEGHVFPPGGIDYVWDFLRRHDGSGELSLADGLTDVYPDYCALAQDFVASDAG